VTSVAVSPDGTRIVSGNSDGTLRFWDAVGGGALPVSADRHNNMVTRLAFSPDGRRIVSASTDGDLRVWNAESGAAIGGPLQGHKGPVFAVAWNADGSRIASGGHAWERRQSVDHVVRVWDPQKTRPIAELEGHEATIENVAFTRDGHLVSGSSDGSIRVWDLTTKQSRVLAPKGGLGAALTSSPDGALILASSGDDLQLWDAASGTEIGGPLKKATTRA
jgi:WD40 repeat protein